MTCSANQEQIFLPLDQSGMRRFALEEKKVKKQCLRIDESLFNSFPPLCCKENYFNLMTSIEGDLTVIVKYRTFKFKIGLLH